LIKDLPIKHVIIGHFYAGLISSDGMDLLLMYLLSKKITRVTIEYLEYPLPLLARLASLSITDLAVDLLSFEFEEDFEALSDYLNDDRLISNLSLTGISENPYHRKVITSLTRNKYRQLSFVYKSKFDYYEEKTYFYTDLKVIINNLMNSKSVEQFSIENKEIYPMTFGSGMIKRLIAGIKKNQITNLTLTNFNFTAVATLELFNFLARDLLIEDLNLSKSSFVDRTVITKLGYLIEKKQLRSLSIDGKFYHNDFSELVKVLRDNKSLRYLSMISKNYSHNTLECLHDSLMMNSSLKEIKLSDYHLPDKIKFLISETGLREKTARVIQ